MEHAIEYLMREEHKKIRELLEEFKQSLNNLDSKSNVIFNKFKWSLEKHFFVEEKAIFSALIKDDDVEDIFELMQQHQKIMEKISSIEDDLDDNIKPDISELIELLIEHSGFENDSFYPKLDDFLSTEQKKEIINRAKEIIKA